MSKPNAEVEVKVYLVLNGKYTSKNLIFTKAYQINELDNIANDIRSFLHEYQNSIATVVNSLEKPIQTQKSPEHLNLTLGSQATPIKQEVNTLSNLENDKPSNNAPEEKLNLKFVSAGGCYNVEASAHLLNIEGHWLLFDAGYSEKSDLDLNLIKEKKPEAVFITHAHLDHVGSLPIIHKIFPNIPIFMTLPTKRLAYKILEDSVNVASSRGNEPPFTKQEVAETLNNSTVVNFNEKFDFKNLKITFRCAGHILGAAYIVMEGSGRVLYTGDISTKELLTTPPAYIPRSKEGVDLLISESTYGASSDVEPRDVEVTKFCSQVNTVLERGGRVLIPSFALGRAQEILAILLNRMNYGTLKKVPVILDGMARDIAKCYEDFADQMPSVVYRECRKSDNLRVVIDKYDRAQIISDSSPSIIIASSGMLAGGPSVAYAREILSEEKSAILTVGYSDEETPARQLTASDLGEEIELLSEDGKQERVKRKCEIGIYRLSAHSNQAELVNFSQAFDPKAVFLVHGEKEKKVSLANALRQLKTSVVFIPENRELIDVGRLLAFKKKINVAKKKDLTPDELNLITNQIIEKLHEQLTFEDFLKAIDNEDLLGKYATPRGTKDVLFSLFNWSLKYSQTEDGLDFKYPSKIIQNGVLLLQMLFGNSFGRMFLYELGPTLPKMFKNFITGGGRANSSGVFKLSISSKEELEFSLGSFKKNFLGLGILIPTFIDVQKACIEHSSRFPDSNPNFLKVFGKSFGSDQDLSKTLGEKVTTTPPSIDEAVPTVSIGQEYTCTITSCTEDGDGIAIVNGVPCHIAGAGPGELIKFRIKKIEEKSCVGELVPIIQENMNCCLECGDPTEETETEVYNNMCKKCYYRKLANEAAKLERRSGAFTDRASTW